MRKFRRSLLTVGLLALLFHFLMLVIYGIPALRGNRWYFLSSWYVNPLFHQNWELFVPPPSVNYMLFVNAGQEEVAEIFGELVYEHQTNRLKGLEPMIIAITNTIHYFEKNSKMQAALNGPVENDLYFSMMEKMALSYYNHTRGKVQKNARLYLLVREEDNAIRRVYFN